jgi:hypothetical protein
METSIPNETSINDYIHDQPQQPIQPSSKPLIAGIFLIIAGLLGLFTWASAMALDVTMIQNVLPPESPITAEQLQSFLTTCGIIGAGLSIFTLAGGIVALKRKAWGLAVIGGILGLFTIGPFLLGSIISLIGLIIVATSRKDFQ